MSDVTPVGPPAPVYDDAGILTAVSQGFQQWDAHAEPLTREALQRAWNRSSGWLEPEPLVLHPQQHDDANARLGRPPGTGLTYGDYVRSFSRRRIFDPIIRLTPDIGERCAAEVRRRAARRRSTPRSAAVTLQAEAAEVGALVRFVSNVLGEPLAEHQRRALEAIDAAADASLSPRSGSLRTDDSSRS